MQPARISKNIVSPLSWESIPCGELYRDSIEQHLHSWMSKLYGFHLLKIGNLSAEINTEPCPISHQVNIAHQGEDLQVIGDPYHLPFESKSVDACLLCHTLTYASDPHWMLREVDRVLIDDGWLILTGYNPLSLLGLGKLMPGLRVCQPFVSRMYPSIRLLDWLSLLNYEVIQQGNFHVLPWRKMGGRLLNTHFPALGCVTAIVARKRTLPLTPSPLRLLCRKPRIGQTVGATKSL
jgi:SAM-dependent methyltransferase